MPRDGSAIVAIPYTITKIAVDEIDPRSLNENAPDWRTILNELQGGDDPYISDRRQLLDRPRVLNFHYGPEIFLFKDPIRPRRHISPIASGSSVRADNPFEDIRRPVRGTVAIDMEGAAFYLAAANYPATKSLLVKGVCDYADTGKDDSYHHYASMASATYIVCFIREYVTLDLMPRGLSETKQLPKSNENLHAVAPLASNRPSEEDIVKFLSLIEDDVRETTLINSQDTIALSDIYIPIEVTLERIYQHDVETTLSYAESEVELKRAYAMKGATDHVQPSHVPWDKAKDIAEDERKIVMVLGDPGMGKTSLLKMEAGLIAHEQKRKLLDKEATIDEVVFPILLPLIDVHNQGNEVIDAIPELVQRDYQQTPDSLIELLREKLRSGKCVLLLDALDEVPMQSRNDLGRRINRFARANSCLIICTSRIVGYSSHSIKNIRDFEIVPFGEKQTEQYLKRWFVNAAKSISDDAVSVERLIRELRQENQPIRQS